MRITRVALLAEALILASASLPQAGCSDSMTAMTAVPVQSIVVTANPGTTTSPGGMLTMLAMVMPANASSQSVTWSVSDPNVATIDPMTGVLTGVSVGTVVVTATATDGSMVTGTLTIMVALSQPVSVVELWGGAREASILKSDGTVWDWGGNINGHLGIGTTSTNTDFTNDKSTPAQVHGTNNVGFLTGIKAMMGGEQHNFALRQDGTVWSWGNNSLFGQLGDGTLIDRYTPVQVVGLSSVALLGGRGYHSLAVKTDGTIWTWGCNRNGELGDGTLNNSSVPVQVQGISGPKQVSGGGFYSLALKPDGTVWAWGSNVDGQLGNNTTTDSMMPVQVLGLSNITAISGGWLHALALKSDGTVWAWGNNASGETANGANKNTPMALQVAGLSNIIAVSGGDNHSSALRADGTVWKWGANDVGELGIGTTDNNPHPVPVQVPGLSGVTAIAARDYHNLARKMDGSVWMWGANDRGQCGDGTTNNPRTSPVKVVGLP